MSEQDDSTTTPETSPEESTDEQDTTDATGEESQEDDRGEAWDPERAQRLIGKLREEKRRHQERATQAEKKASSVDDLTKENGGLKATVLQLEVGYELGLPLSLAKRLQGSTREEMLTDAESLVELVSPTKAPATRRPAVNLRGGGEPEREPEETDTRKIAERMFRS